MVNLCPWNYVYTCWDDFFWGLNLNSSGNMISSNEIFCRNFYEHSEMLECVILYNGLPIASVIEKNLLGIFTQKEELFYFEFIEFNDGSTTQRMNNIPSWNLAIGFCIHSMYIYALIFSQLWKVNNMLEVFTHYCIHYMRSWILIYSKSRINKPLRVVISRNQPQNVFLFFFFEIYLSDCGFHNF